jgi:hypothetical protein
MRESIRNHAGCPDPTAYFAIARVSRTYRPFVFICSPYAGDIAGNTARARKFCRLAVDRGCIPVAPHLFYPQFLDDNDEGERKLGLFMGLIWLTKCAEIWVFGNRVSAGMAQEIRKAQKRNMIIRYFDEDLREVRRR